MERRMTNYYLSNAGSDSANGLTPATAWATIDKLKTAFSGDIVVPGDTVMFRSGDEFFLGAGDPIWQKETADTSVARTVIKSYGEGPKPIITAFKDANQGNAGLIEVDGVIYGAKKDSVADCTQQWDFYNGDYAQTDTSKLFTVYSVGNPASITDSFRIGPDTEVLIFPQHNTSIYNLDFYGSGNSAVQSNGYWGANNVIVKGCDMHALGGSWAYGIYPGTRIGNGLTVTPGSNNWTIENNNFWDIFDAAMSIQGNTGWYNKPGMDNIHFRNNRAWNCNWFFEPFIDGSTGTGITNSSFTNNICFNAGKSWSQPVRLDPVGRGTHVLVYQHTLTLDVVVENNIFFGAETNYLFTNSGMPEEMVMRNNAIFLEAGTKIRYQDTQTIENAAAWQTATGYEEGSVFTVIPAGITSLNDAVGYLSAFLGAASKQTQLISNSLNELAGLSDANRAAIEALQTAVAGKANASHTHTIASVTGLQTALDGKAPLTQTNTSQGGTAYTLTTADAGTAIDFTSATAVTVTVPANADAAVPIGSTIELTQYGAGQITVAPASGVTVVSRGALMKTAGQYAVAGLRKRATNEWVLVGDLA
jgi:hypothetical protein